MSLLSLSGKEERGFLLESVSDSEALACLLACREGGDGGRRSKKVGVRNVIENGRIDWK